MIRKRVWALIGVILVVAYATYLYVDDIETKIAKQEREIYTTTTFNSLLQEVRMRARYLESIGASHRLCTEGIDQVSVPQGREVCEELELLYKQSYKLQDYIERFGAYYRVRVPFIINVK